MEDFFTVLARSPLFAGVPAAQLPAALACLGASRRQFGRGDFVLQAGQQPVAGIVAAGGVQVVREDVWGGQDLVAPVGPGELFAESYACLPDAPLQVSVVAAAASTVFFLEVRRLAAPAESPLQSRLALNLLSILAQKNLALSEKLAHMAQRTIRRKLLSYLSAEAARQGSLCLVLPLGRQQLADYLGVDRSALSRELGNMRREGLVAVEGGRIRLLGPGAETTHRINCE